MAKVQDSPIYDDVIEGFPQGVRPVDASGKAIEFNGKARLSWILYFQNALQGDVGTNWNPTATSLGATGTPTITGIYYQNNNFTDFYIQIIPGTDTTSIAGTTYFDLPFDVKIDTGASAVSGGGGSVGMVVASSNRVYPPAWSAVTVPVTISGRVVSS